MQYEAQITVVGVEKVLRSGVSSKTGNEYDLDWTDIHYLTDLDMSQDAAAGQTVAKLQFGTAANYDTMKNMKFPVTCKATLQQVQQGNRQVTKVISLTEVKG